MSKPLLQLEEDFLKLGFVQKELGNQEALLYSMVELEYPKYFRRGKETMHLTSFVPNADEKMCFNISYETLSSNLPQRYLSLRKSPEAGKDRWHFFISFSVKDLVADSKNPSIYAVDIIARLDSHKHDGPRGPTPMYFNFKYDTFEAASLAFKNYVEEIRTSLSS